MRLTHRHPPRPSTPSTSLSRVRDGWPPPPPTHFDLGAHAACSFGKLVAQLKCNTRHIVGGIAYQAIAAIENAVLDIVGKAYGAAANLPPLQSLAVLHAHRRRCVSRSWRRRRCAGVRAVWRPHPHGARGVLVPLRLLSRACPTPPRRHLLAARLSLASAMENKCRAAVPSGITSVRQGVLGDTRAPKREGGGGDR